MGPLVAMENALFADRSLAWPQRCAAIAAAGFDGVYAVPYPLTDAHWPAVRTLGHAPAQHGLRLAAVYASLDLAFPESAPSSQRLLRLLSEVDGAPRLELSVKCSDPVRAGTVGSAEIVDRLAPLLALAAQRRIAVALYPHSFYPLDEIDAVARLLPAFGSPRPGCVFATSHVYALHTAADTSALLVRHARHIASFNLSGCRRETAVPPARCRHLPLGEGDLDPVPLLRTLAAAGYRGELIVQGHGWTGGIHEHLRRSATFLRRTLAELSVTVS